MFPVSMNIRYTVSFYHNTNSDCNQKKIISFEFGYDYIWKLLIW